MAIVSFNSRFNHSPTGKIAVILTTLDCVEYIRDRYSFQYIKYIVFNGASPRNDNSNPKAFE